MPRVKTTHRNRVTSVWPLKRDERDVNCDQLFCECRLWVRACATTPCTSVHLQCRQGHLHALKATIAARAVPNAIGGAPWHAMARELHHCINISPLTRMIPTTVRHACHCVPEPFFLSLAGSFCAPAHRVPSREKTVRSPRLVFADRNRPESGRLRV